MMTKWRSFWLTKAHRREWEGFSVGFEIELGSHSQVGASSLKSTQNILQEMVDSARSFNCGFIAIIEERGLLPD